MSVTNFLHNLGIISGKTIGLENDPNLQQGQEFMEYEKLYTKLAEPHLEALQITSIPGINSIVETYNTQRISESESGKQSEIISQLEKEFNKTLVDYKNTYQIFFDDVLKHNKGDKSKYFNKTVTTGDGNYIYVNDYGFTHKYSTNSWKNNDSSCPEEVINISEEDLSELKEKAPMGLGQPCKIAGKNIINTKTKEVAWVDIKGYKHIYSDDLWKQKDAMCNTEPIKLSNKKYNAIPNGNNMTASNTCNNFDVDPTLKHKLIVLNNRLLILANELNKELNTLKTTDTNTQTSLDKQKNILNNHLNNLSNNKDQIINHNNNFVTISAKKEDTSLAAQANRIHYIVWRALAVTLVILTVKSLLGSEIDNTSMIIVILFLVSTFIFAKWLHRKF